MFANTGMVAVRANTIGTAVDVMGNAILLTLGRI